MKWFTPAPWKTVQCSIDLRAGGLFTTTMRSPEGENFPKVGCYLEIVQNRKLVWTDAREAEFRPSRKDPGPNCPFLFTATILLEPHGQGTKYTAIAMHRDASSRAQHEAMSSHEGWGTALDQLIAVAKKM
jgi:uncharacterized protein YndB with AHSA1/START domain